LPKPKASGAKGNTVDPYVTVEVFGIPADCAEERTKTVNNTGMIYRHTYLKIRKKDGLEQEQNKR